MASGGGVACGRCGSRRSAGFSQPPGADHRGLRAVVLDRHHRALDGEPVEHSARPAVRGGEPAGGCVRHRRRSGRALAEGRPHAAGRRYGEPDHRTDQSAAGLRHPARLHAGDRRRRTADDPDGAPFRRRQQRAGADRAGEVEARRTALWLDRRRRQSASADRTVLGADRHQDDARALSGQPAGHHRPARRPHPPDAVAGRGGAAAHRLRRAQGAGVDRGRGVRRRCPTCRP